MSLVSQCMRRLSHAAIAVLALGWLLTAAASEPRVITMALNADTHTVLKAEPDALYRSNDDGRKWQPLTFPDVAKHAQVTALAMSPRAPHPIYVAVRGVGVLRSADGGKTWTVKATGLPTGDVVTLTAHADQPATVYAYVKGKGIFRSEDTGDHWRLMDAGPRNGIVQLIHSNMPGSMQSGWLFAATGKGVARSMDCFCGWRDAGALGHSVSAVAYDPEQPKRVYAATANGLFVSDDGGEQWLPIRSPRGVIALLASSDGVLLAADEDAALFRSRDRGLTWRRIDE